MVSEAETDLKDAITNDDQWFLMYFIIGTYFGPDIKTESATKKSILQRVAEGFPPYTLNQLTNSFIKVVELERVYYYILRNSDKSLILKLSILHRFFQGQGENINYPKFSDLFPPQLHPQSRFKSRHKIIHNIVFINNPDTRYIKSEDVERFKRLTGLQELHVDREAVKLQFGASVYQNHLLRNSNMLPMGNVNNWSWRGGGGVGSSKSVKDAMPHKRGNTDEESDDPEKVGEAMLFLPSPPSREELANMVAATKNGIALTGSAAKGQCGPTIGLVDIGECEDSYLFRVSLPGVKRDETEFNCEVAVDGEVFIHGITITGEKTVSRYSHVFKMLTQNLCPPGKFSIRFKLPGSVDPNRFSGNFGTDGILEGVVMKLNR